MNFTMLFNSGTLEMRSIKKFTLKKSISKITVTATLE